MPVNVGALQPGDILLCYGWNKVGKAQGVVKAFTRAFQATDPLSFPLRLASQGAQTWGNADCNHAIIVGDPKQIRDHDNNVYVRVVSGKLQGNAKIEKTHDRIVLEYTDDAGRHSEDITLDTAAMGQYSGLAYEKKRDRDHVIKVVFQTPKTTLLPRIAHSTGGGCIASDADAYIAQHTGKLEVFRLADDNLRASLAQRAGQVAITWAADPSENPNLPEQYSKWKAFTSILGTSSYGPNAKARAKKYRAHRAERGGPPSDMSWGLSRNKTGKKEWFCSMFVIACYHAASTDDAEVARCLPLDAKHTTPMLLDGYLRRSGLWTRVASLP